MSYEKENPESSFESEAHPIEPEKDLEFLHDIKLRLTAEFGRTKMSVGDLLKMKVGSVITLQRGEDDPVVVRANGNLVAKGEVLIVNEKYGIRITGINNPIDLT